MAATVIMSDINLVPGDVIVLNNSLMIKSLHKVFGDNLWYKLKADDVAVVIAIHKCQFNVTKIILGVGKDFILCDIFVRDCSFNQSFQHIFKMAPGNNI
jgi:hypothetical protein